MHHPTDRSAHTTAFVTPVVEHWLEREIAQWVHPMKDRSNDPSHHERTLLPRSYISLPRMSGCYWLQPTFWNKTRQTLHDLRPYESNILVLDFVDSINNSGQVRVQSYYLTCCLPLGVSKIHSNGNVARSGYCGLVLLAHLLNVLHYLVVDSLERDCFAIVC